MSKSPAGYGRERRFLHLAFMLKGQKVRFRFYYNDGANNCHF